MMVAYEWESIQKNGDIPEYIQSSKSNNSITSKSTNTYNDHRYSICELTGDKMLLADEDWNEGIEAYNKLVKLRDKLECTPGNGELCGEIESIMTLINNSDAFKRKN